jgi:hypothetical protein
MIMEKAQIFGERIKFIIWAKKNEFDTTTDERTTDHSDMPAFIADDTYMAWAGWLARAECFYNQE